MSVTSIVGASVRVGMRGSGPAVNGTAVGRARWMRDGAAERKTLGMGEDSSAACSVASAFGSQTIQLRPPVWP